LRFRVPTRQTGSHENAEGLASRRFPFGAFPAGFLRDPRRQRQLSKSQRRIPVSQCTDVIRGGAVVRDLSPLRWVRFARSFPLGRRPDPTDLASVGERDLWLTPRLRRARAPSPAKQPPVNRAHVAAGEGWGEGKMAAWVHSGRRFQNAPHNPLTRPTAVVRQVFNLSVQGPTGPLSPPAPFPARVCRQPENRIPQPSPSNGVLGWIPSARSRPIQGFRRPMGTVFSDECPAKRTQRSAPPPPGICFADVSHWPHGEPPHPAYRPPSPPAGGARDPPNASAPRHAQFTTVHAPRHRRAGPLSRNTISGQQSRGGRGRGLG